MQLIAKYDNETMRITKGHLYIAWRIRGVESLINVEHNDIGDSVIMSIHDFEEEEE